MELVVLIAFFAFFYIIDVLQKRKIRKEIEDDIAKKRKISSKNKKSSAQLDELFKKLKEGRLKQEHLSKQPKNNENIKTENKGFSKKKSSIFESIKNQDKQTKTYQKQRDEDNIFVKMGNDYERHIGKQFEKKGELVIYNGFIKGYEDKGVDIISICNKTKNINLVQCKNWKAKEMSIEHLSDVYNKLNSYDLDFVTINKNDIENHLSIYKDIQDSFDIVKNNISKYKTRKTLYLSSDKVIDLNIGKELQMMNNNIFKYKDMKIVIAKV
jgi:hypothetical protein